MSRFFGYSHYYALQRRSAEESPRAAADETGVPGRTLLLLGFLAVSGGIAVCLALAS